ncbi:MAG: fixJ [Sphingomonadales bacterium]|nr:fixJ [Sphingomonadales bacterium]
MFEPGKQCNWVYVIDDDSSLFLSLADLLPNHGIQTRQYWSVKAFLNVVDKLPVGCVVMEARLTDFDPLITQDKLTRRRPDLPIILVARSGDIPLAVAALKHGAVDFFAKPIELEALIASVKLALEMHEDAPELDAVRERLRHLTPREREVLDRIVAGDTSKEIARTFHGSPRTVEVHRSRVLAKLGARNVADAVRIVATARAV